MKRSLLGNAAPLIAARAVSAVLTFAIPVILARRLSVHDYGTYKQLFLIATTCYLAGQIGIPASLSYFLPRNGAEQGRYLMQALAGLFVLGAFAAAAVLCAAGELGRRFDNPQLVPLALPLALHVWWMLAAAPLEIALTATGRTGWAGLATVLSDLVRTASLVVPCLLLLGVPALAWAAAGFAFVRLIAAWVLALSGRIAPPQRPTRVGLGKQLRYAVPFGMAVVLLTIQVQLPQYVVSALTDPRTFAVYAVGATQVPLVDALYAPIVEVMAVGIARVGPAGAPDLFREAVARLAIFFLPLLGFAWAIAVELIPTLYTYLYVAAAPLFAIGVTEIALAALPVDGLLRAVGATRTILWTSAARLVLAAVLVPVGLLTFGLPGAMAAYIITQTAAKIVLLLCGARALDVPLSTLLPTRALAGWAARAAVLFVLVTLLRVLFPLHGWAFLSAAGVLAALVWVGSLAQAGELRRRTPPKEEVAIGL